MPTYEYKCLECGNFFEIFQKITEEAIQTCPKCKGHVKRLIGAGLTPMFKGSGFYHTDYKVNSSKSNRNDKPIVSATADTKKTDSK